MTNAVLVTDADGVRTITLNRPAVMNALDRDMRAEITAALRGHDARAVVLTGTGRA